MIEGINKLGVDWLLAKAWLLDQRDAKIALLLNQNIDHPSTQFLRGEVAMIDALIAAAEPAMTPEAEEAKDYV